MTESHRPRSLAEMEERTASVFAGEHAKQGAMLRLRPTDVVITPYGKSGTTWTQQIFHTLRTGGDMDFDDISRVVPWIEMAGVLDMDINAAQKASISLLLQFTDLELPPSTMPATGRGRWAKRCFASAFAASSRAVVRVWGDVGVEKTLSPFRRSCSGAHIKSMF